MARKSDEGRIGIGILNRLITIAVGALSFCSPIYAASVPKPIDGLVATRSRDVVIPTPRPEPPKVEHKKEVVRKADTACLSKLSGLADFEPVQHPKAKDEACIIPTPVILSSTKGRDPVKFPPGLTLDCKFAVALAEFTNDTLQPLAKYHFDAPLKSIATGPGFHCRRRNNKPDGKLSEHAFGNGIDFASFKTIDGKQIAIRAAELAPDDEAAFLNAVRKSACGTFTTVLGPGSNSAHDTHFHFDRGRMKPGKAPYLVCE